MAFNSHDGNTCRRQYVWCLGMLPLCECLLTTCWSSWHLSSPLSPLSSTAGFQETPETTGKQLCAAQTCSTVASGKDVQDFSGFQRDPKGQKLLKMRCNASLWPSTARRNDPNIWGFFNVELKNSLMFSNLKGFFYFFGACCHFMPDS